MYDVVQGDDVCVLELLEQGCLSYGGEGSALLLLQADLLQGNHLVGQTGKKTATFRLPNLKSNGMMSPSLAVPLEDGGVGSLPQLLELDVGLQFPEWRIALQKEWGRERRYQKGKLCKDHANLGRNCASLPIRLRNGSRGRERERTLPSFEPPN